MKIMYPDLAATFKYNNQVDDYHRQKDAEIRYKWLGKMIG